MMFRLLKWMFRRTMAKVFAALPSNGGEIRENRLKEAAGDPWGFHTALVLLRHDGKIVEQRYSRAAYYRRARLPE